MKLIERIVSLAGWFTRSAASSVSMQAQSGTRGQSEELHNKSSLAQRMRWGVVGMNGKAFVIAKPTRPDAPWLRARIEALQERQLHHAAKRDFVGALNLALDLLTEWRGHRHAIIYLTAGGPSGDEDQLTKFLLVAVEKVVAVHGVYLGANPSDEESLQSLCTKRQMGFGDFHSVATASELENALEDCIDALVPRPWNSAANRVVFVVDHSGPMGQRINGQPRMKLVSEALVRLIEEHGLA